MSFFTEYALLVAVALPVVTILAIQAFLFACGERGTLLVPGPVRHPSMERAGDTRRAMPAATNATVATESSNDEIEREAA